MFEIPEKKTAADGSPYFMSALKEPIALPVELKCESGRLVPNIQVQTHIQSLRIAVLEGLCEARGLFKTPPKLERLEAITPVWGIVIVGSGSGTDDLKWHTFNVWDQAAVKAADGHIVHLVLKAVEISRHSVLPVWSLSVLRRIPELPASTAIDFDFGDDEGQEGGEGDVCSIHSSDLDFEEGVVHLMDASERKRICKQNARELLRRAAEAQMAADAAVDRFYADFDLSEGESDLSEVDED